MIDLQPKIGENSKSFNSEKTRKSLLKTLFLDYLRTENVKHEKLKKYQN